MKKLIIMSMLVGLLTACGGKKVNTTSKAYKKDLLSKIYEKNDREAKAMLKMSEETKALVEEIRSRKGNGW